MHYTVEELISRNHDLSNHYVSAAKLWEQIVKEVGLNNVETLAQKVTHSQWEFERRCGGRNLGQEVMVLSGFGRLYSTGAGLQTEQARNLYEAFKRSSCSLEVKGMANTTAKSYGVIDNDE